MMKTLEGEGITFDEIFIDRSMPAVPPSDSGFSNAVSSCK